MKAVILEDEKLASNRLLRLIKEVNPNIIVEKIFVSIRAIANYLIENEDQPDILFLDIHVLDGNSLELFNIVEIKSKVIFTTAYDEYAIKAFRHNATDYLLKPIKKEELEEAIGRATVLSPINLPQISSNPYKERILIRFGMKILSIKSNEIAYIFSKNKISYFYTFDGKRTPSDYRLQNLEKMLDPAIFFRLNRQFVVHFEAISSIKTHNASRVKIELNPPINEELVISTDKTRIFKNWLDR